MPGAAYLESGHDLAEGRQLFGEDRIADVLAVSAENIPERLLAAVNTYTAGVAPDDDLTLVVLRR